MAVWDEDVQKFSKAPDIAVSWGHSYGESKKGLWIFVALWVLTLRHHACFSDSEEARSSLISPSLLETEVDTSFIVLHVLVRLRQRSLP